MAAAREGAADAGEGVHEREAPEWFASLYRDSRRRVYNVAARIVGNPDDAADIVQDVFLRVFTHPPDARTMENPQPWLYRITVNACFDHLRRRTRRTATNLDDAGEIAAPHDGFEAAALTHAVEDALGAISPRYRAALVLRDLQGLENDEVALALGTSPTTARVLVHRARGAFRKAFRSLAPAGSGALSVVALIGMLPELPLPASLQAVPVIGAATVAATAAGTAATAAATSAAASTAAAGAAAAAPAGLAPVPAAGLLAKLAAAGIGLKGVAVTAAAVTVVAGGGLAAEQIATRDNGLRSGGHDAPATAPLHEQQRHGAGESGGFGPDHAGAGQTGGAGDHRPDTAGKADAGGAQMGASGDQAGKGNSDGSAGDGSAGDDTGKSAGGAGADGSSQGAEAGSSSGSGRGSGSGSGSVGSDSGGAANDNSRSGSAGTGGSGSGDGSSGAAGADEGGTASGGASDGGSASGGTGSDGSGSGSSSGGGSSRH